MIKKIEIDGESIYINKGRLGWSVVHPIKNDDGSINWKNLICGGAWWKLGVIAFVVIVILGCLYEYSTAVELANKCLHSRLSLDNFLK